MRQELQPDESEAYLANLVDADFTSKRFWILVYSFGGGATSASGKRLMALRNDFAKATTTDSLELKIAEMYAVYQMMPQQQISDPKVLLQTMQDLRKQAVGVPFKNLNSSL
jgi:hypothetical protein